jgi:hypothetical protein
MATMLERMRGAALLDVPTYEEVEADRTATSQAAGVVALVALAQAIGASGQGVAAALVGIATAVLGWLIWSGITYLVGDKLLGGTATWGQLLRTLGFAQSPGLLYAFGIVPLLGGFLRFAVGIWILIAGIIAIRQACDFSTGKAIITAVIGWVVIFIPVAILGVMAAGLTGRF